MSKSYSKQAGFTVVEALIVVAVLAIVGFVGYTFTQKRSEQQASTPQSSQTADKEEATQTGSDGEDLSGGGVDDVDTDAAAAVKQAAEAQETN
ncbi:MAG: hypothetical protein QG629_272 [Patescibacteria group bacterium]|nr:prepilin-type N-terminal cleavage/methylation domain-containing protein [Candidatus Saccharibacteria bacterium]MDQ5963190.1 hypothetical protein [Patescibacteria group bacterium]